MSLPTAIAEPWVDEQGRRWIGQRKSMEPWIKDSVVFYPHQVEAIRRLARIKSFILADDMGLGKSLQALSIFAIDIERGFCKTAIVICPTSLKGNWLDEIEKFTGIPGMIVGQVSPAKREEMLNQFEEMDGPKILIMNYEQIQPHLERLNRIRFDVAIFDEAHYLKNWKAKRTKACLSLFSRRSMMLTGTPLLNRVNELWSLMHRVQPDRFRSYWNFTHRYCLFGGFDNKEVVGTKNEAELKSYLAPIMVRRMKSEVLDLPSVQIVQRRVDLLPEQRKIYKEIVEDMKTTMMKDPTQPVDVENALTKFLRLKQVCGTTLPFNGSDYSAKLDLAIEDDSELLDNGRRVVVFTQFRDVQLAYGDRLQARGYPVWNVTGDVPADRRSEVVKEWGAAAKPGALVCMLQVAGVGLNMTQARDGAFLDKLFVPGLNQQAIDRLHRIGASATQPVMIREYICRNTIENRVEAINKFKKALERDIIGGVEDIDFKKKILAAMMEELE